MRYRAFALLLGLAGCSTAFEVGEALNKATSNVAADPARYVWSKDPGASAVQPASAPAAASP